VNALGDGLEHLDVDSRGRAIVSVVLEFAVIGDALRTFDGRQGEGRMGGDARNDRTYVKGENGRIHIHGVWVEDWGVLGWGKNRIWEPRGEWVLVRAISVHCTSEGGNPRNAWDGTGLVYLRAFATIRGE
jgi:hypothetical protein